MSDHETAAPPAPPLGLRVVRGGEPTAEELAALVVALIPRAVPASSGAARTAPAPAWARASRLEAVGGAPLGSAADLAGRTGAWS